MTDIPIAERYLNLAIIHVGEALSRLGNLCQREGNTANTVEVRLSLQKAIAALEGKVYQVPVDPQFARGK